MSVPPPSRLRSLDAFRGLAIAGMILVNNPGSWAHIYPPLEHAEWNGWTPTDLIFPFFIFIVGVSLTFSFARRLDEGADRGVLRRKIVTRAAAIFAIGLALNFVPRFDPATVRIMGVLQRIALAYLAAALIYAGTSPATRRWVTAALLLGYWFAMTAVPVPGYGRGVLLPVGNLAQYVDAHLLAGHMWRAEWDPEGFLSTLPAVATCLLGTMCGDLLRSDRTPLARVRLMLGWGVAATAAGLVWGFWFPINKSLWTSSYTVFTAGLALVLLGLLYWLIDVRRLVRWAEPLYVFGANALLVFVLSGLAARGLSVWQVGDGDDRVSAWQFAYERWFASWAGALDGSLAMAIAFVLIWLGLMTILYRRRIFVRL